ncbi:unnamed protein product, partial [Dibothriocephalus latus]
MVIVLLQNAFMFMADERNKLFDDLTLKHASIGRLLTQCEGMLFNSATGKHPKMASMYQYWEKRIFDTIYEMTLRNLNQYLNFLQSAVEPVFSVDLILSGTDVVGNPQPTEFYRLATQDVRDAVKVTRVFIRWQRSTCIFTPAVKTPDHVSLFHFNFFQDISKSQVILSVVQQIDRVYANAAESLKRYQDKFRRYKYLFNTNKVMPISNTALDYCQFSLSVLGQFFAFLTQPCCSPTIRGDSPIEQTSQVEKWMSPGRTIIQIHEKILEFTTKLDEVLENTGDVPMGFYVLRMESLQHSIRCQSVKWVSAHGEHLRDRAHNLLKGLQEMLLHLTAQLRSRPKQLDQLKAVLQTIKYVQDSTLEVEEKLIDIDECHRLLRLHGLSVTAAELEEAGSVSQGWLHLVQLASSTTRHLMPTKQNFVVRIQREVAQFTQKIAAFAERFATCGPGSVGEDLDKGLDLLKQYQEEIQQLEGERHELLSAEKLLDLPISTYAQLTRIFHEMDSLERLYRIYGDQKEERAIWSSTLWNQADFKVLSEGIEGYLRALRRLPKEVRSTPVGCTLGNHMRAFRDSLPLFANLKHEALRPRHWAMLMERTGHKFAGSPENFTLGNIFSMELHRYEATINEVLGIAMKEFSLEKGVVEIEELWQSLLLNVKDYMKGEQNRGLLLSGVDEIMQLLDDNALSLQSMNASRFVRPFLDRVQSLDKSLSLISEVLETWMMVQRKWMYMEGIFVGGDIRTQLPEEAQRFDGYDKKFRQACINNCWALKAFSKPTVAFPRIVVFLIMHETAKEPGVRNCCLRPDRLTDLKYIASGLEACQKSLSHYLQAKRNVFPRFFFISDDELLGVLGSGRHDCAQQHMIKMFDNISHLNFVQGDKNKMYATTMCSTEGEELQFSENVLADGRVENWLTEVEDAMKNSNRRVTKEAVANYRHNKSRILSASINLLLLQLEQFHATDPLNNTLFLLTPSPCRVDWMLDYQGMIIQAASQIWSTWEVEDVFKQMSSGGKLAMKHYGQQLHQQLNEVVARVRGELTKNDRTKLTTMLIIDVHLRDIVDGFIRDSIMEATDFEWESQLRFYWVHSLDDLKVYQCNGLFDYGYEYMGLSGRLVITPLTDRIYLTLTQALSMYMGGAPAGPAGTGKTETVKDLAKALGLFCLVTNCGESMDYRTVGKIFSGLCQCGAWGCFDEFNRIEVSVLSVISTQLKIIQTALMQKASVFRFEDEDIKLKRQVGIFITMNPGYAGRTELPESVKTLFRQVVVVVPDMQLICEIMLFSQGFSSAKILAKKMTTLYKLAEEQLSKQYHYDFGLRALKSVLIMAGNLRRSEPDLSEENLLMRSMRDMNLPKLVYDDVQLFLDLIQDLFPGVQCPRVGYPEFNQAVKEYLRRENYVILPHQVDKVVQLYETMHTRHTTMVVGPTSGGKTVIIQSLCRAQEALGTPTKLFTMNPKDRSVEELYGVLDPNTRDWTDGLLSKIFRDINTITDRKEQMYILFDGDVDALWVENMNSVMDDNRLLTLANGERLRLQAHCALLFEVGDLQYASPATISRCGMVYVEPRDLGYEPFWKRWLARRTD